MSTIIKTKQQVFLTTKDLDLVLLEEHDAHKILEWFQDPEVNQFLNGGEFPITTEFEKDYISKMYKNDKKLQLGIYHRKDQKLIGTTGIDRINNVHLEGSFGIAIGNKEYWGNGYGTQTLETMLYWSFKQRGLRTITLSVLSTNPRGMKCYQKCGFTHIGTVPKSVFKQGKWVDRHLMMIQSPLMK
ncbi:MAG: GNAT family N-acetyltransferase [Candidatus Nomurabacteria bacterium]|nr:GNAT family N-acetyltransferase [Candidatus Nomurabacteria bacterium]USN87472.1 MAG: GNAT family N-acetyltransferase [Candidatus Nomurabacteria bacterium]